MGSWSKGIHSPINNLTQEDCYLVANQDVRGVGQPYAVEAGFREASLPVDPTRLYGSTTSSTMASIPSPIVGKYIHLPDGTVGTPGLAWASDTDTGLYRTASGVFHVSINGVRTLEFNSSGIALPSLSAGRVTFAGASGQLTDDAGLTYDSTSDRLILLGTLRIGTATDTSTAGDFAAGLSGSASRFIYDQSAQTFWMTDSSANVDFSVNAAGNSWYNGTGNFGFGNTSPGACVDIVDAVDPQLRLGYTATDYAQFDFSGELTLTLAAGLGYTTFALEGGDAGSYYLFQVRNTDNTNGASGASVQMQVAGTSAGDPYIVFDILGGSYWLTGADNSDSDKYKITTAALSGFSGTKGLSITSGIYTTFSPAVASSGTAYAVDISGAINTGGSNGLFRVLAAASTAQTASTEIRLVNIDLSAQLQWATGALANERAFYIAAPTLRFVGASTVTNAATVYIDRAPQVGTNATITNAYALWVDDGAVRFDGGVTFGTLTATRVVFAGTGGVLTDDAGLVYDAANDKLTITGTAGEHLRLAYDGSNYVDLRSTSAGALVLTPSGSNVSFDKSTAGAPNYFICSNSSNTAGADATYRAIVGGTSGGDAVCLFSIPGVVDWSFGFDNSDSDSFKVSASGALGSSDRLTILTGGNVGVNTNGPDRKLDVLDTGGPQLRLTYTDGSVYTDFHTTSGGVLLLDPTGGILTLNAPADPRMNFTVAGAERLFLNYTNSTSTARLDSDGDLTLAANNTVLLTIYGSSSGVVVNEAGGNFDFRVESDDESYCLMVEATLNNLVFCANAEPGFNTMDGGVFLAEANVVPTGNPTAGGYLYVEGGALKYRGTSGTVTTVGPA